MKRFISDCLSIYALITGESATHYICGTTLYPKADVVEDYHPLDNLDGVLHVVVVPFYNY